MSEIPSSIIEHQHKYHTDAWKNYSLSELGNIVAFFVKRSGHRSDKEKAEKDITDAQNYLNMMQSHVAAARERLQS